MGDNDVLVDESQSTTGAEISKPAVQRQTGETVEQLRSTIAGKDGFIKQLNDKLVKESAERERLATALEAQQSETSTKLKDFETVSQERSRLLAENSQHVAQKALLAKITDPARPELASLLPLWADNMLNVGGLEGEALDAKLTQYAERFGGQVTTAAKEKLAGTTPAGQISGRETTGKKTASDLATELMHRTDFKSDEYKALKEQHFAAVEAEMSVTR